MYVCMPVYMHVCVSTCRHMWRCLSKCVYTYLLFQMEKSYAFPLKPANRVLHTNSDQYAKEDGEKDHKF